ncbi:hypothetical protein Tco_1494862 [Tanacetum coccineum]
MALWHGIPLDLHHVALTKGWTMDKLPDDMIGAGGQIFRDFFWIKRVEKEIFLFIKDGHTGAMAWRHHDSDVNDPVPEDGFSASDVQMLTERVIDLRPVPSRLLFHEGLATK